MSLDMLALQALQPALQPTLPSGTTSGLNWGKAAYWGGTALQGFGQIMAGSSAAGTYKFNAAQYKKEAAESLLMGRYQRRVYRKQAAKVLATQRAKFGYAGLRLEGSPLMTQMNDAATAEFDAGIMRRESLKEYQRYMASAAQAQAEARAAKKAGIMGGIGSVLSAAMLLK